MVRKDEKRILFKNCPERYKEEPTALLPLYPDGSVMVMMSYIIFLLSDSDMLIHMKGGDTLRTLLTVGSLVIATFSLLFLLYSNSFLHRRYLLWFLSSQIPAYYFCRLKG